MTLASALAAMGLVAVHLTASRLRFLDVIPRSRLLSAAGGMSVAYVFLRILPDLAVSQAVVGYEVGEALRLPRHPIYVVALLGLVVFYGLERLTDASRRENRRRTGEESSDPLVFWISMLSYSVVNFAVGYLLPQRAVVGVGRLSVFFLAMAVWFVVNDYGLRVDHRQRYRRRGRWVLSAMVVVGWAVGVAAPVAGPLLPVTLAFVGGGIVLNVLKEELPRERESRFWAFALGAGGYAGLLLAIG